MPAITTAEMRALEERAIAEGWTEEALLDLAGKRLGLALGRFFARPGMVIAYLGKGHNAGDALVALGVLRDRFGWKIAARFAFPENEWAPLTRKKTAELGPFERLELPPAWPETDRPLLLIDGLLGIGAKGCPREPVAGMIREMKHLRHHAGARIAAVDLPSGVDPDTGIAADGAVTADATFMIGAAKTGLAKGIAANFTGALAVVPVEPLTSGPEDSGLVLICPQSFTAGKSPRPYDFHKGSAGRVGLLVGSFDYPGAAAIAASGALRGGAGLVTVHAPPAAVDRIAAKCPPEVIVRSCEDPAEILDLRYDALVIGCGLGDLDGKARKRLFKLVSGTALPTVLDADALNHIARAANPPPFRANQVVTPHPGEFSRLAPDLANQSREDSARSFTARHECALLLKGSRTLIASRGRPLFANSTGGPGMATGGQGDLLAGAIGARLALGEDPATAAAIGAWQCGRAAERALELPGISEESLLPSDCLGQLGGAAEDWRGSLR